MYLQLYIGTFSPQNHLVLSNAGCHWMQCKLFQLLSLHKKSYWIGSNAHPVQHLVHGGPPGAAVVRRCDSID